MSVSSPGRLLREDAAAIWCAAVAAVDSERLVRSSIRRDGEGLSICGHLLGRGRICVVGGGKAGAGMAAGLEASLADSGFDNRLAGWVNVPADCVRPLRRIHLHPARPAGVNEPAAEGVRGAEHILDLVTALGPQDTCIVLLSGGASALLPAPVEGISLDDKLAVTRFLSRAGAMIQELNCVRKQLSRIKGGRLAQACSAGTLICLIISDVIGDPLDTIASGPTVPNRETAADALDVLRRYDPTLDSTPPAVVRHLEERTAGGDTDSGRSVSDLPPGRPPSQISDLKSQIRNHVIGNNRTALDAAASRARVLGYRIEDLGSDQAGVARDIGAALADRCRIVRAQLAPGAPPVCVLSGGEPVVHVVPTDRPQRGGRNQELVLAAAARLWEDGMRRMVILSGGTDGEDGPTDAAGALADAALIERARSLGLDPHEFLRWNNAYPFFEPSGGLLKTGPTHTNVMDVRVALIGDEGP
jgi:hydroxypyruvate reductase